MMEQLVHATALETAKGVTCFHEDCCVLGNHHTETTMGSLCLKCQRKVWRMGQQTYDSDSGNTANFIATRLVPLLGIDKLAISFDSLLVPYQ